MSTPTTQKVKPGQNVVKQGLLNKAVDRYGIMWNERWTVLQAYPTEQHYYLYRYKSKAEQTNPTSATKIDSSTEIGTLKDKDGDKALIFYIENKKNKEKFQFKAKSKEEMIEWIKCIKNAILAAYSPDNDSNEETKEAEDALSEWLTYFGLIRYDCGLREAGLDDFELVKTLTDDDISGFATEVSMKTFHKKKFNEAISKVKNGVYNPSEVVDPVILALREKRKRLQGKVKRDEDANDFSVNDGKKTRNIIFIGETGAGKTTLINSMINHLECVSYTEPFRYNLIMESKDDDVDKNKAKSQTKKITKYHLRNLPAIDYNLNVVDTPGFGDTNGPQQDIEVRNMFQTFFQTIDAIDGVYFVLKSSDTRLTGTQQYIFDMVLNVFGADIKDNIFVLFTFADGAVPPVLEVVKQIDVFKHQMPQYFKINNSGFGLPGNYKDLTHENFFKTGNEQFKIIFEALSKTQSKSIANTLETLTQRENLTTWLFNIGQHVKAALDRKKAMDTSLEYLKANKDKADANKDFKYPDEEVDIIYDRSLVKKGKYTTYCPVCISTCHKDCGIKDNGKKYECWAMTAGVCGQCKGKCDWNVHKNEPFVVRRETKIVWKTKKQMAEKYKLAAKAMVKHGDIMKAKKKEIKQLEMHIMKTIEKMRKAVNILQDVALNKNVLTPDQYFDTLIASEENGEEGWQDRIKLLEKMKDDNKLLRNIVDNDDEKVFQQVMITDMDKYNCSYDIPQATIINVNNYNINVNHKHVAKDAESQSGVVVNIGKIGVSFGATVGKGWFFKTGK